MVYHSYEFYISSLQTRLNTTTVNNGKQHVQKEYVPLCYYLEQEKVLFFLLAPSPYKVLISFRPPEKPLGISFLHR